MYRIRNLINANGNMTSDRNKGIYSITYNELNLPARIEMGDDMRVLLGYRADVKT